MAEMTGQEQLQALDKLNEITRFGFRGSLTTGLVGMLLVVILAVLDAFTAFVFHWSMFAILCTSITVGAVAFGILSLREVPKLFLEFSREGVSGNVTGRSNTDTN